MREELSHAYTSKEALDAAGDKKGTVVSAEQYALMQYNTQNAEYTAAITGYNEQTAAIQNQITTLQQLGNVYSSLDVTKLPTEGTAAWEKLNTALSKVNVNLSDFSGKSKAERITLLAQSRQSNLAEQITQQENLLTQMQAVDTTGWTDKQIADWTAKIAQQQSTIQGLYDQSAQIEIKRVQDVESAYIEAYNNINTRIQKAQQKAAKQTSRIQGLTGSIQDGKLTNAQMVGLSDTQITNWQSQTDASGRAKLIAEWYKDAVTAEYTAMESALTNNGVAKKQVDDWKKEVEKGVSNWEIDELISESAFTEALEKLPIDDALKGQLLQAWKDAFEGLSEADIKAKGIDTIFQEMYDQLVLTGEQTEEQWNQTIATMKDNLVSMYQTIGQEEAQAASAALATWESTFKEIASLRQKLLKGEDISGDLFGSFENYMRARHAYGDKDVGAAYRAGTLKAEDLNLATSRDDWIAEFKKGYNYDAFFDAAGKSLSIDQLAAQAGILKSTYTTKNKAGEDVFDEAAYRQAVQARYETEMASLLYGTGQASTELEAKNMASYFFQNNPLDSSAGLLNTAGNTLQEAGNALLAAAGEYADNTIANNAAQEAASKYQGVIDRNASVISDNTNYGELTRSLHYRGTESISSVTEGEDTAGYLAAVNTILARNNLPLIQSLTDMATWGDEQYQMVQREFDEAVSNAYAENTAAGETYLSETKAAGYSEESQTYKDAQKVVQGNDEAAGSWQPQIEELNALAEAVDMTVEEFQSLAEYVNETA